jgi:hypothetical protein
MGQHPVSEMMPERNAEYCALVNSPPLKTAARHRDRVHPGAALSARIRVYRGADLGVNERGYSWSLERSTAERFPFYMRYRAKAPVR